MGHQQNSVDITHLQAIALDDAEAAVIGGGSNILRARGTPSSLQPRRHARATTATIVFTERTPPIDGENHGSKQWDNSQTQRMPSNNTLSEGDTQEAPDWADYCENQKQSLKETGQINIVDCFEPPAEEDSALCHDNQALRNDDDGEDGILGNDNQDENENDEEPVDLVSQDNRVEDLRAEPFPESRRFQQPMTPHVAGAKRKRPEEEPTPLSSTPRLPVNPFVGLSTAGMMRGSQLFRATQAQTSPLLVHSDSLSERPSPNINQFGRPSTAGSLSSPVAMKAPRADIARAVTEPQGNYVSMKESQDAREQHRKQLPVRESDPFDDDFELLPQLQQQSRSERERGMLETQDLHPKKDLLSTTMNQSLSQGKSTLPRPQSNGEMSLHQKSEVVLISDATPPSETSGNVSEDETELEEERDEKPVRNNVKEGTEEDNKENIEVPMTVIRQECNQMRISQSSPSKYRVRSGRKRSATQVATQVARSPQRDDTLFEEPILEGSSQCDAPSDSLSSQKNESYRLPAPHPPSSSPNNRKVIPQSQLSQRLKSLVPQSSIPNKAEVNNAIVNLVLSSPLQVDESDKPTPDGCNALIDDPGDIRAENPAVIRSSTGAVHENGSPHSGKQDIANTEPSNIQKTKFHMPPSSKRTIPETNSAISRNATSPLLVANSSQDMNSSGPVVSPPTSKFPANDSLSKQSPGTTVYETAQDRLSTSTSRNVPPGLGDLLPENSKASPSRESRRRTLDEIMGDMPLPDAVSDINFDDLDPFKEQESSSKTFPAQDQPTGSSGGYGTKLSPNRIHGRQPASPLDEPQGGARLTRWKISLHAPLKERGSESPTRPTSSAISWLTPEKPCSSKATDSSSPLSSPPTEPGLQDDKELGLRESLTDQEDSGLQEAPAQLIENSENQLTHRPTSDLSIVAPNRVFAHFNGDTSAFYTATCLGVIPSEEPRYSVRYDDGAEACINAFGIKRLEFRPGDVVKIDLPEYKNKNFSVIGVTEHQEIQDAKTLTRLRKIKPQDENAWPETDIYGHAKVLLVPKRIQPATLGQEEEEPIAVGLFDLYFTQAMWANLKNREYLHVDHHWTDTEYSKTSADHKSTPSSPSSRLKRLKPASLLQSTGMSSAKQGLFTNMAFTLTNVSQNAELERTKSLILAHGGRILDDGFDAIFHVPTLHRITSPKKSDLDRDFHPTRQAHGLGFTCLIADKHCRRAKYIQALALGIPCLSTRWIGDCLTKQRLLSGSAYLLPAGESTLLGGAVHSRVLPAFTAETGSLSHLLEHRPQLLKGSSILLIMSKNEEESMRQYPLLILALNPTRVARALSIEAAAKSVAEAHIVGEPWDWVFTYDKEREVERILFGNTSKKRKNRAGHSAQELRTRVIGNEFIVQSLISGQLVDG